jgi:hypothetical protein
MENQDLKSLPLEEKLKIAEELYLQGHSLRKIGVKLGIHYGRKVSVYLKQKGYKINARVGNSGYDRESLFEKLEEIWLKNGGSIKALCKEYHTTPVSFTKFLRSKGHHIDCKTPANEKVKEKKLAEAEQLFKNGFTVYQAARAVKINNAVLSDYLKEKGCDTDRWRIHLKNQEIFKVIDTEEKAYWLGFLYADGYIVYNGIRYGLELALKESDYNHLVKFKRFLQTEAPIKKRVIKAKNGKEYVAYRISIFNKHLVKDLVDKGCVPNKSLTLIFPSYDIVPKNLMHHFIRGYFDGDGSIYLPKVINKKQQASISFVGTKPFLLGIRKELNLSDTKMIPTGKAFTSVHGGNRKVATFFEQIYHNATVYLDRKYMKYREFVEKYI